jgi:modulator of FtsH protease HflK
MPWGENNKSNDKKDNNRSPWENDPRKNNNYELGKLPDIFNEIKNMFFGGNPPQRNNIVMLLTGAVFVLWLMTGFYNVQEGEQAIVIRFGKYVRSAGPGLNYHLPSPIEQIIQDKVEEVRVEQLGFRASAPISALKTGFAKDMKLTKVSKESLMLTGDENIVDINFVVQWRIKDLKSYIFNVSAPVETVRESAESATREVIGNTTLINAITKERSKVEHDAKELLQKILDTYNSGIEITTLIALKIDAPQEVIDAFRDVQTAKADKERLINQAESYRSDILPRARGASAKIIQEGEAYKNQVVAKALGEVFRFDAVYNKYKNAKEVTRSRMYLESMEDILKGMEKVIIENKNGIVPYMQLPKLGKE